MSYVTGFSLCHDHGMPVLRSTIISKSQNLPSSIAWYLTVPCVYLYFFSGIDPVCFAYVLVQHGADKIFFFLAVM